MTNGDRVEATERAFEANLFVRGRTAPVFGTVGGQSRSSEHITVRLDGNKTVYRYHRSFWKLAAATGYVEREGWLRCECGWRYRARCTNPLHWPDPPRFSPRGLTLEVLRPRREGNE